MNVAGQSLNITLRDYLSVIFAILILQASSAGRHKLTICTYHHALKWILNLEDAIQTLAWLQLRLSEIELHGHKS